MLDELKSKLKELAELRRDIQVSDEYIAERKAEYEATEAYKSYKKAAEAKSELENQAIKFEREIQKLLGNICTEIDIYPIYPDLNVLTN